VHDHFLATWAQVRSAIAALMGMHQGRKTMMREARVNAGGSESAMPLAVPRVRRAAGTAMRSERVRGSLGPIGALTTNIEHRTEGQHNRNDSEREKLTRLSDLSHFGALGKLTSSVVEAVWLTQALPVHRRHKASRPSSWFSVACQ
jgi:hypothetical protein